MCLNLNIAQGLESSASLPLDVITHVCHCLLQGFGLTDYAATADAQTLANDNWQGGINPQTTTWTIDGVTRPAVSAQMCEHTS